MKKDKRLQEYANKSTEKYNSPDILAELKQHIQPQEKWYEKLPKKTWYAVGGSLVSAIVVVVLLCVFLIKPDIIIPDTGDSNLSGGSGESIKKEYFYDGQSTDVMVDEINQATFIFDYKNEHVLSASKHCDVEYQDTLFYRIEYYNEETFETFRINIVTNEGYDYEFQEITPLWQDATYKGYQLLYREQCTEEDGLYYFKIDAILETDKEDIAIYYEGISLEETSNLLSVLDQIFVE